MDMNQNYTIQQLLFYVAQDFDDATRALVLNHVHTMADLRDWVIGPPKAVYVTGENSVLGGILSLYSAIPRGVLPVEIDRLHLKEVKTIVESLVSLSQEKMLAFEFELDGEFVGSIEDGKTDRSLEIGLIGEWEKSLNSNLK
jgi:hypothetical protein